jgi:predicted Zn-dependent protease with MMP-like domain
VPIRRRGTLARRHPERRVALPPERHAPFERLVERALDELPDDAQRLLANVAIVIAETPTPDQALLGTGEEDGWLYGLYEGVPLAEYGADLVPFPNKITLFRLPLETDFPDPRELAREVRRTVLHELAHHAGFGEGRMRELGLD